MLMRCLPNWLHLLLFAAFYAVVYAAPKFLICGDSTTADYNPSNSLQGWGYFLNDYMSIKVVNRAKNGRSTRSFIAEGSWASLLSATSPGDFVVIEMGHNDGNDPRNGNASRASRGVLPGTGENTINAADGQGRPEKVHTFGWYLRKMAKDVQARQATPLISGMVPRDSWRNNAFSTNWPMANDAQKVAREQNIEYVDHTKYSVARFQAMGERAVKAYFPKDSTHTNAAGARVNAETFVTALRCSNSKAVIYIGAKGKALTQRC